MWRGIVAAVVLTAGLLLLTTCAPSPGSLRARVADKPGVIQVRALEVDGEGDIPFQSMPLSVEITMDEDATADEVLEVFEAYDSAIDRGGLDGIDVTLAGPKWAVLSTGEGVHGTREAAQDLVAAQADGNIAAYRREAYPVLPSVEVDLVSGGFDDVVAVADRYRGLKDLESVSVASGRFLLIRDAGNEDQRITNARQRLVQRVASTFELSGAIVSGRGPLDLCIEPEDAQALKRLVGDDPESGTVGRVAVLRPSACDR